MVGFYCQRLCSSKQRGILLQYTRMYVRLSIFVNIPRIFSRNPHNTKFRMATASRRVRFDAYQWVGDHYACAYAQPTRDNVTTSSLIGWAHTQIDPWWVWLESRRYHWLVSIHNKNNMQFERKMIIIKMTGIGYDDNKNNNNWIW